MAGLGIVRRHAVFVHTAAPRHCPLGQYHTIALGHRDNQPRVNLQPANIQFRTEKQRIDEQANKFSRFQPNTQYFELLDAALTTGPNCSSRRGWRWCGNGTDC